MQRIGPLKEYVKHLKKVEKDEAGSMSVVQGILLRTDFLRRIISPVGGQGGVTLSYVCPHCNSLHLEDYTWWVSTGRTKAAFGGVWFVVVSTSGEHPAGYWSYRSVPMPVKQKFSRRMRTVCVKT